MKTVKKIYDRMSRMCDGAWFVLKLAFVTAAALLAGAALLFAHAFPLSGTTYFIYRCAKEMFSLSAGILLVGVLVSAIVEDIRIK